MRVRVALDSGVAVAVADAIDAVGVAEGPLVRVPVGVRVEDGVAVRLAVAVDVGVELALPVRVGEPVGVLVRGVPVSVELGVLVARTDGVGVDDGVKVWTRVRVGLRVMVGDNVTVGVRVDVAVAAAVGVRVGDAGEPVRVTVAVCVASVAVALGGDDAVGVALLVGRIEGEPVAVPVGLLSGVIVGVSGCSVAVAVAGTELVGVGGPTVGECVATLGVGVRVRVEVAEGDVDPPSVGVTDGDGGSVAVSVSVATAVFVGVGVVSSWLWSSGRSAADMRPSSLMSRLGHCSPPKIAVTASLTREPSQAPKAGVAKAQMDQAASTTYNRPPPLQLQTTCAIPRLS